MITGATGSFGKRFISRCLRESRFDRIVIFSRDELKQYNLRQEFEDSQRLRWFIGDVRDRDRLEMAMYGVDSVVHAAALKQVDTAEYNPMEFVKTNVLGSQNVIEAAIRCGVKKVIALSTDKASSPINLYGATKLTADKLFIAGNAYGRPRNTIFSVVRYGNVVNSRGSVVPHFKLLKSHGKKLTITDERMTRFWLNLDRAIDLVNLAHEKMFGGELFVPKIPSVKITDVARAIDPDGSFEIVGIRPGEKLHEEMISREEGRRALEASDHYIILPTESGNFEKSVDYFPAESGFRFSSDTNKQWLSIDEIKKTLN